MKKSFTLIEPIVVIAIIAVLTTIISVNVFKAIEKAKVARVVSDLKTIKSASLSFYADTGRWPVNVAVEPFLEVVYTYINSGHPLLLNRGWDGPYLEKPANAPSWIANFAPGCVARGLL